MQSALKCTLNHKQSTECHEGGQGKHAGLSAQFSQNLVAFTGESFFARSCETLLVFHHSMVTCVAVGPCLDISTRHRLPFSLIAIINREERPDLCHFELSVY